MIFSLLAKVDVQCSPGIILLPLNSMMNYSGFCTNRYDERHVPVGGSGQEKGVMGGGRWGCQGLRVGERA